MLRDKININDAMRSVLLSKRKEMKITGSELSIQIQQTPSYISAIENSRIKRIPLSTLIKIIKILFDVDDEHARRMIEEWINQNIDSEKVNAHSGKDLEADLTSQDISEYDVSVDNSNKENIYKFADMLKKILNVVNKKNPASVERIMKAFPANISFDIGFMLAIWQTPFFAFDNLSHEERQKYLDEFSDLFQKYALLSKSKVKEKSGQDSQQEELSSVAPESKSDED